MNFESTVSFNDTWRDEVAQATCTAVMKSEGWMFAVRRQCSTHALSCDQICAQASLAAADVQISRLEKNLLKILLVI